VPDYHHTVDVIVDGIKKIGNMVLISVVNGLADLNLIFGILKE